LDLSTARDVRTADVEKICKLTNDVYRNRWITFAYWNISRRLKKLTGDNANWCTFSTWSSRTIGENLRIDKPTRRIDDLIYDEETSISVRDHPWVLRLQYLVTTRDKEAAQLALALGNRLIFHEIGYAMIQLLEWIERNPDADFQAWQSYRQLNVNAYPDIPKLFPLKDEDEFWDGLDTYVLASRAQTERTKAQLVLRGNVLLVAYEQKRLEPILKVALEPFPGHFVRVVQANPHAEAELSIPPGGKPWAQRDDCRVLKTIAEQFASFLTRYVMTLDAPLFAWAIRPLRLGRGIPRPDTRDTPYPPYLETLDGDVATLFEEHDLTGGAPERCGAHNWTDLADRMNHIVNLFRVGQQDPNLYRPLPDADLRALDLDFSKKKLDWLRTQGDDEVDDWFRSDAPEDIDPQPYVRALLDGGLEPLLGIPQFNPPPPLPRWADRAKLWHGQRFFRRYGLEIGAALFAASLPYSYTAARGAQVLTTTKMLVSDAHKRIGETGQMLLDAMASEDASLPPLAEDTLAYKAARGVRLFHGAVRHMLLNDPAAEWNEDADGKPINQEDLLGTLAVFTVVIVESLDEMGVTCTVQDRDAYFHLWLVLGDLLGIDYDKLFSRPKHRAKWEPPLTYADMHLLSRVIFQRNAEESDAGQELMTALATVSENSMPRLLKGKGVPAALTRRMIGDEAADMLNVAQARIARAVIAALRPFNALISPYVRTNVFGAFSSDLSSRVYKWWIDQTGARPIWRFPSSYLDSAPTRVRRHAGEAVDRMVLVPRPVRARVSRAVRGS
jgi:hypothetical protein